MYFPDEIIINILKYSKLSISPFIVSKRFNELSRVTLEQNNEILLNLLMNDKFINIMNFASNSFVYVKINDHELLRTCIINNEFDYLKIIVEEFYNNLIEYNDKVFSLLALRKNYSIKLFEILKLDVKYRNLLDHSYYCYEDSYCSILKSIVNIEPYPPEYLNYLIYHGKNDEIIKLLNEKKYELSKTNICNIVSSDNRELYNYIVKHDLYDIFDLLQEYLKY
jgi:hypothetical protein